MTPGLTLRGLLVVPLEAAHLAEIEIQPSQAYLAAQLADAESFAAAVLSLGPAFAGLIDGRPVVVAGTLEQWPGRWIGWAILSALAGPHMKSLADALPDGLPRQYREGVDDLEPVLIGELRPGDVVMIKSSKGVGFSKLVDALIRHFPAAAGKDS